MALLSVRNVSRRFGGIIAIDDVSLDVEEGEIVGLIGPNGAGKTTLFNVVTRLYKPDSGVLELDGKSLLRTPPYRIVRRGIARTFQNVELFRTMSVVDNVLVGAPTRTRPFAGAEDAHLYVTFLGERPEASRVRALSAVTFDPDEFEIRGAEVYLHIPNGYGRSKLSNESFEKRLGVAATTRN